MKYIGVVAVLLFCGSVFTANLPGKAKECSRGPTYWCQNITSAASCGAVKHCIQTVWELQTVPKDNDSVCQVCLDMVKQARDQLESNETQDELKQVFEGSCQLILLKPIVAECKKLADQFIPELVETLASQMNPQVVCSVAGLCNNARIDAMLAVQQTVPATLLVPAGKVSKAVELVPAKDTGCENCQVVASAMKRRFQSMPKDDFLNNLIELCGKTGSLSDGCAAAVITHFNAIYRHLEAYLDAEQVCHLVGTCDSRFHQHPEVPQPEVTHESQLGVVARAEGADVCDMCQQLVKHLQDMLVANTTEIEFQEVLQGLCKQSGSFEDECLSLVNQYYGFFYNYLVKALVPKETCEFVGICPPPIKKGFAPIVPLLPAKVVEDFKAAELTPAEKIDELPRVSIGENGAKVRNQQNFQQLPIERTFPLGIVQNSAVCAMCEYFLHYVQEQVTDPASEAHIKDVVEHACDRLPKSIEGQCREFVDTYGDAFVALLAQEIDPSQMCPSLGLCPKLTIVDINADAVMDKSTCPLCLFAVQELDSRLQDNKTEASIRTALQNLCAHLPKSLIAECKDFVKTYEEQLIDMLIADFTPQEVCVYLHLCDDQTPHREVEIMSNDIPPLQSVTSDVECVICEFVLTKIDALLKNETSEAEVKHIVTEICDKLPRTVSPACDNFVDRYGDLVAALLAASIEPKQVCQEVKLCMATSLLPLKSVSANAEECLVCEATMGALEGLLEDPTVETDIGEKLAKACTALPASKQDQCRTMTKIYGPSIINLVAEMFGGRRVCVEIALCSKDASKDTTPKKVAPKKALLGGKKCTWGPSYWCQTEKHASSCGATKHCQEKVWLSEKPSQ